MGIFLSDAAPRQRLSAILAADAAGFSRLMNLDEHATVAALDSARSVFQSLIETHRGRVIDMAGDSVLAVFETAAGAVSAALSIQRELAERALDMAAERRMEFRIGVHLGDVIEKNDGTIYGDGVNIAARLQSLAESGGVTISASVQSAVSNRIAAQFEDLGDQTFKNIASPVHVYRVRLAQLADNTGPSQHQASVFQRVEKPTIAVMPFINLSGDPVQEYFADGITEDIITELSRFRDLFVISRNSSFKYKGQTVDVQLVARELCVKYVVEGSVRKAGNRVRITVQLIDSATDRHIWAERYDRELADIFEMQDEVTAAIVATLPGRVEAAARERVARASPENMAAYECLLEAKMLHHRSTCNDNVHAQQLIDRALGLDPNYAHAHAWKACVLGQTWTYNWCVNRRETENLIADELQIALALDETDSDTHRILAAIHLIRDQLDQAAHHQQRALALNPNDDLIVVQNGEILTWLGHPEEGIEWICKAMRLNPFHPERFWHHLGRAQFVARRYAEAKESFQRMTRTDCAYHTFLAACAVRLGDRETAAAQRQETLNVEPRFSIENYLQTLHYTLESDRDHHRQCLLDAELPA